MHGLRLYDVVQIWGFWGCFFFLPENRALSQDGPISSHQVNEHEYTDGLYDEELFKENMMEVAQQVAKRIDGTLHCGRPFAAYIAPNDSDWPIKPDLQEKIKNSLMLLLQLMMADKFRLIKLSYQREVISSMTFF